jgi:hypothetical protein
MVILGFKDFIKSNLLNKYNSLDLFHSQSLLSQFPDGLLLMYSDGTDKRYSSQLKECSLYFKKTVSLVNFLKLVLFAPFLYKMKKIIFSPSNHSRLSYPATPSSSIMRLVGSLDETKCSFMLLGPHFEDKSFPNKVLDPQEFSKFIWSDRPRFS